MKVVKSISLFFVVPCILIGLGIYIGIVFNDFFYPGESKQQQSRTDRLFQQEAEYPTVDGNDAILEEAVLSSVEEEVVLNADTEYVLEEYDTRRGTLVESSWSVPAKYLGMNREEFIEAMELYAAAPPLSEQERGFIGLEVRAFSSGKVIVRMNYAYVEPTKSFYLRVENNSIVVYCDDNATVYMYTDIKAETLPEYIQTQVIMGMFMEDEAALYHFLETYSS